MKFIKTLALALALTVASAANAYVAPQSAPGWDKLSDVQKAEIQKQIAEKAAAASDAPIVSVQKIDEYTQAGERIGKMLGGAAKELGVAVNTFIDTPAGKWTLALIVWKLMGASLTHIFGGVLTLVVGIAFIRLFMRRRIDEKVTYDPNLFLGVFRRKLSYERGKLDDSDIWFFSISTAIVIGASLIVILTGIQ